MRLELSKELVVIGVLLENNNTSTAVANSEELACFVEFDRGHDVDYNPPSVVSTCVSSMKRYCSMSSHHQRPPR